MSQTIKRKGKTARKAAAAQGNRAKVRSAKATGGSALDMAMGWLPFTEAQLQRLFVLAILAAVAALAWVIASAAGVPGMAEARFAQISKQAGFEVKHIELRGVKNINELKIYERALAQKYRAMPLVDLEQLRSELFELPWVEDARVSRQLPTTLVIDIVERSPRAVLRKADTYALIDETGHELEVIDRSAAKGKLIVSGEGAGQEIIQLSHLLEAAPALKPRVREAQWVGNRRWNLVFETGQVLALPEGVKESAGALVTFARLDGTNRLIGGRAIAIDMRAPDRVYLRVPEGEVQEISTKGGAVALASGGNGQ
ncbi:cell division protein FtsQ/DivIB [Novosphingobium mangrovi (ex Hu et al. 2023)]|uniref:Cell division protein FtsQ n=1 Tax=Novosphingobium mangrovi (ex Hu et al. 2023) TaxID=2930094 RepID=A0ABT0A8C8_9SPHN|nr:FtsQ-type POTRA domain-containing protein [Novosphingobium mangrovi (ex Hu et al. 2023)]MCJ1959455.1 FtsQ-type POTRA domain-containing protein [Novosphingobium mangrovi (ex Hu et al. 2023)]